MLHSEFYLGRQPLGSWRLIPIWDALQAPCSANTHKFSSNAVEAFAQGKTAGNNASDRMNWLSFGSGSIAYLDIEYFSGTSTCSAAAKRYVAGFVNRMHANGFLGGLYTSSCGPDADMYAGISDPPDDIWVAAWNGIANVNDDSMGSCFSGANWTGSRRIHQYRGGGNNTWGGHTVNVDLDCVKADVVGLADCTPGC